MKHIQFEGTASGFVTRGLKRKRMTRANKKAEEWINAHPEVQILHITASHSSLLAIVTVWYQ